VRSHGKVRQRPLVGEISLNTDFGDEIPNAADDCLVPLEDDLDILVPVPVSRGCRPVLWVTLRTHAVEQESCVGHLLVAGNTSETVTGCVLIGIKRVFEGTRRPVDVVLGYCMDAVSNWVFRMADPPTMTSSSA
jgi:hypothetical protein